MRARLPLLALLLAARAWGLDVQYEVAARSDVRTRTVQPGSLGSVTSEVEVRPSAGLLLGTADTRFGAAYRPSLLFRDPFALGPVGLLHRGQLLFTQRWPLVSLRVDVDGSWGTSDISALRPADTLPPGSVETPTLGLLPYVRLWSRAGVDWQVGRRVTLGVDGGYQVSGSPGDLSLPMQQGPFAALRLGWRPTERDTLTTTLQAAHADFVTGQVQTVLQGTQTWRHTFTARTGLSLSGGVAFTREDIPVIDLPRPPQPGLYRELLPVASVSVDHRASGVGTVDVLALARLGPFQDRFTGNVYERLEALGLARWRPVREVELTGTLGGGWAVDIGRAEQLGDRIVYGDVLVAWTPEAWLLLQGNARLGWSAQPSYEIPSGLQWLLGVAVTFRDAGPL
ncbi:MAG: hypothetical protein AMXMBFR34_18160 [Myxococcaceae bacterium]